MSIKNAAILTANGLYRGDTEFGTPVISEFNGNVQIGCKILDARRLCLWAYDVAAYRWVPFDLSEMARDVSRPIVSVWKYARAAQFDRVTGRTFFLQPFRSPEESPGMYGKISVCEPTDTGCDVGCVRTIIPAEYDLFIGAEKTNLRYALDMKLDAGRRKLWILDSGNGRILRVNVDTGKVDRTYKPQGTTTLCSMAIDPSTGVAYVRALGRAASEDVPGESSSSSSTETNYAPFYETIYAVGEESITTLTELSSFVGYSQAFMTPTDEFILQIILNLIPLPFPGSSSMAFDATRGNLWWLSKQEERTVFVSNVRDKTMRSIGVGSAMASVLSVTIDQEIGEAVVGGQGYPLGAIVVVDVACTSYSYHPMSQTTVVNDVVIADQDDDCIFPFVLTGTKLDVVDESSSSSFSQDSGDVFSIDRGLVADEEVNSSYSTSDGEDIPSTPTPIVKVRVWTADAGGMAATRTWPVKGSKAEFDPARPSTAPLLPRFSWSANAYSGKPSIAVGTSNGDLIKMTYSSGKLTESCSCQLPTGGEVLGVSAINGDGNVYVSGNGIVARINVDPTEPGESVGSEETSSMSSSQSGSSSLSGGEATTTIVVSEQTGDTRIAGLSVQHHEKGGRIFMVSRQTGMLTVAHSIQEWADMTEYGPFQEPFKAIWSRHHTGVILACKTGVNVVSIPSGERRMLQGLVSHETTDVSERDGMVAMTCKSFDGKGGMLKIVADDLSKNLLLYQSTGEHPSAVCLLPEGKAVVALEETVGGNRKTRLAIANLGDGTVGSFTSQFDGGVVSLFHDDNFGISFAAAGEGNILAVTFADNVLSASVVGSVSGGISAAKGGLVSDVSKGEFKQKRVRVIVGSRPWSSDRWDSGVVTTGETTMLYGGGDNLSPGDRYWATILVQDATLGWSSPFVKEFVAPIM